MKSDFKIYKNRLKYQAYPILQIISLNNLKVKFLLIFCSLEYCGNT